MKPAPSFVRPLCVTRMIIAAIALVAACKPGRTSSGPDAAERGSAKVVRMADAAVPDATPSCVDDDVAFDRAALEKRVGYLASTELDGRVPGTAGDRSARAHIVERFRCLGLVPGGKDGSYEQPFAETANVVGYVKGNDAKLGSEIIVVGAHHDHLGGGLLGANDNASGVAALLSIAQAVRQHGAPRRTIAFVTFGAEEEGLVGSLHYVANPPAALPLDRVVQMINLDMVGSHASAEVVYAFGAFPKLPSRTVLAELDDKYPKLNVGLGGHSVRGDQLGFCKKGIPYVFFWTPDSRCYHKKCDTADKLDYPRMADIASLAGGLVQKLADTDVDLAAAKQRAGCGAK